MMRRVVVRLIRFGGPILLALTLVCGVGQASTAQGAQATQASVTSADIQRLQDNIYEASRDIGQLRSRDAALASRLETELDEARDEAIYLKVKIRKNERIARTEYSDLRNRVESIRTRAGSEVATRGSGVGAGQSRDTGRSEPTGTVGRSVSGEIPVGTEIDVRLQTTLSSATAHVEDRFEATTMVDLTEGERVVIPAGSSMRGVVSSVNKAGRVERTGKLTVAFDQITIRGRNYPIRATVTEALESEGVRAEAGKIGTGAGVGAIIGGILGGLKGAIAGVLIGAGGTIAATEGTDVELPPGTVLRVRFDTSFNPRQ
jgi:hypothetical protein